MLVRQPFVVSRGLSSVFAVALLATPIFAADLPVSPAKSASEPLPELVRALESPVYARREEATQRLLDAGSGAVTALLSAAREGSLEAAVRAVGILETMYVAADAAQADADFALAFMLLRDQPDDLDSAADSQEAKFTADAAESALDELIRTGRPAVADRAVLMAETHYDIRERRAVAEINRLHGVTSFEIARDTLILRNLRNRFNAIPPAIEIPGTGLTMVVIGPKWKGGDEGLKHVAKLSRLKTLYRIEGKQVSDEGIARLKAAVPGIEVQVRGAAKLGIGDGGPVFGGPERGCVIGRVELGQAAANAGLQMRDLIVRAAGQPIDGFPVLIELLRHYKPGDTIEMSIIRQDTTLTVPVTLTGWD
jgi:hypothetical protein